MSNVSFIASAILLSVAVFAALFGFQIVMFSNAYILPLLGLAVASSEAQSMNGSVTNVSLSWHAPNASQINNLGNVINGTGVYGFVFNGSYVASGNEYYGGYNWYFRPRSSSDKSISISRGLLIYEKVQYAACQH